MRNALVTLILSVGVLGCGGDEPPPPPPTGSAPPPLEATQAADTTPEGATELVREVFSYTAGGRDPFGSLVSSRDANLRPLPEDLRVQAIVFDAVYPGRSVAVVRDTTVNERYELRVNDRLGRMIVTEIRRSEVVVTVEQFGVPEQIVLTLRRRDQGRL